MKTTRYIIITLTLIIGITLICMPLKANSMETHVVRISITSQHYDYYSPWKKGAIRKNTISGTILKNNMILIKAWPLTDHLLIEALKYGSTRRYPARVIVKDYNSGLALLTVEDKSFFEGLKPVSLAARERLIGKKAVVVKWDMSGGLKEYAAEAYKSSMEKPVTAYYEPFYRVLVHHMTTGIDYGGNGEPVFIGDRLTGIAIGFNENKRTIRVCGVEALQRMLIDMKGKQYGGVPFFLARLQPLKSDKNLREFLGMTAEESGILVSEIAPLSSGAGMLRTGDVILSMGGVNVDDSGMYHSPQYGRLSYHGLLYLDHFVGDIIKMKIIRQKKRKDVLIKLEPVPVERFVVPQQNFDTPPEYYIFGGLILQEMTRGYVNLWGADWESKANKRFLMYYKNALMKSQPGQKRIVILNRILPAAVNSGYQHKRNLIIKKINGKKVPDLSRARELIKNAHTRFIKIDFNGGTSIILEKKKALAGEKAIMERYNITTPSYP
ncbi:MAG: serine protease [bacterium]|nr:serine protease [bacterium]